jgi:hypothetical protein
MTSERQGHLLEIIDLSIRFRTKGSAVKERVGLWRRTPLLQLICQSRLEGITLSGRLRRW